MVTPTANSTWIKDLLKVATNPIAESLTYQLLVVDEIAGFNDNINKAACCTARKPGGGNKGANVSSITEERISIVICAAKYYEDVGRSIDPNIREWSQIKHLKSLSQNQENQINP